VRRTLILGLAGIALLTAAALAALTFLDGTGGSPKVAPPAPAGLDVAPQPSTLLGPAGTAPATGLDGRPVAPALPSRPAPVVPQIGAWETIAPTSIHSWPRLSASVETARPRLAPCFDEETQARYGSRPFTAVGQPRPSTGPSVLLLQVEVDPAGRFRVVDAPVESRGAEQDGLFSCVQEALRGMELAGRGTPGTRYRIRYPLPPMVGSLNTKQIRGPRVRPRP
jgi:hypothetical protein